MNAGRTSTPSGNRALYSAKAAKQDEFYTQYVDIQKEVEAYLEFDPDTFRGKVVYCNCTKAKEEFSNSQNANIQKWSAYIRGTANRQQFLERALDWVSKGDIGSYMSAHRNDKNINQLKTYFNAVIDWASTVFDDVKKEMQGLEWGEFYERYHSQSYDLATVSTDVKRLYADPYVKKKRGAFEFILGGKQDTKLLEVRVFDDATKISVYEKQTQEARAKGQSNCPLCAVGHDANQSRIYKLDEMDADHVSAWSKGGDTSAKNCQMLCKTHNRAKGNR